jgi:hypothetical protein
MVSNRFLGTKESARRREKGKQRSSTPRKAETNIFKDNIISGDPVGGDEE